VIGGIGKANWGFTLMLVQVLSGVNAASSFAI
jgi:hypothetical protein